MAKNVRLSNLGHLKCAKLNERKLNLAKTGTEKALYSAKRDYHLDVVDLQTKRKKVLDDSELTGRYSHALHQRGVGRFR